MTTICYRNGILAADRRASFSGMRRTVKKIHEAGDYYYAGCGNIEDTLRIAEWIRAGAKIADSPEMGEGGSWGLAVHRVSAVAYHVTGKRPALVRHLDVFHADGGGRDFAIAAMALGKSAVEAVEVAAMFDLGTGDGVDFVEVRGGK